MERCLPLCTASRAQRRRHRAECVCTWKTARERRDPDEHRSLRRRVGARSLRASESPRGGSRSRSHDAQRPVRAPGRHRNPAGCSTRRPPSLHAAPHARAGGVYRFRSSRRRSLHRRARRVVRPRGPRLHRRRRRALYARRHAARFRPVGGAGYAGSRNGDLRTIVARERRVRTRSAQRRRRSAARAGSRITCSAVAAGDFERRAGRRRSRSRTLHRGARARARRRVVDRNVAADVVDASAFRAASLLDRHGSPGDRRGVDTA